MVDDEELLLDVTAGQLEAAGYTVVTAKNGNDALEKYTQHPDIDMLFTDVIMPGEYNGVQLANRIQEIEPAIKVLLMSGFPKQALDNKNGNSDSYSLLNKPYREVDMLMAVRKTLET